MRRKAIIVGSEGQDGRLLYSLLNRQGSDVAGIGKRTLRDNSGFRASYVNIMKFKEVSDFIVTFKPDEVYYLAAFHHSSQDKMFDNVALFSNSEDVHLTGLVNFLEAIRLHNPSTRLFYAASSHIYKGSNTEIQDESTIVNPSCIYGITKASGLFTCRMFRTEYSVYASVGILYNHESIFRSEKFVSRKIISSTVRIKNGLQDKLLIGDLDAVIDWGYAPDYVKAMQMILELSEPDEFIIASGELHTVREFVVIAFTCLGMDYREYVDEVPEIITKKKYKLIGDPSKIRKSTGWRAKTSFREMIRIMIDEEMEIQKENRV